MTLVDYSSRGQVAVLTFASPPVNALSWRLRMALADGVERAVNDAGVAAIVLAGSGTAFAAARM